MKSKPYLIFDFDGTLIDSFRAVMEKFNILAQEFNFKKINSDEINGLKDLTSKELIKHLKIPFYKIPKVLHSARKQMRSEMHTLLPFKNIPETLQNLYGNNVSLGILTSNSLENVTEWLERNKLQHLFNFIHAESSFFGKKRILQKIIKTYNIDKSHAYYIGDETRDVEAAKACNIYSIAVIWGFNSEKILSKQYPHYLVKKPEDILMLFK